MSDMLGGSFGSPIDSDLLALIKARESFFGKERKTEKELEWIHGNAPWVMLRSGVDTPDGGPWTAKGFELKGGTTSWPCVKGQMFGKSAGVDFWGAYKIAGSQGFKPEPGIISVDAKSRDTFGMCLEATVKFKVWSQEDLELMDKIYFKPGFPALLEWGHTMYPDSSGKCVGVWEEKPWVDDSDFYKSQTFFDIERIVQEKRNKHPNYEALLGPITNFSYSVQSDGSYDCSIKMLSKGSVLEGLKIRTGSDFSKKEESKQDDDVEYLKSVYHLILEAFVNYGWDKVPGPLPSKPPGDNRPEDKTVHPVENAPTCKLRTSEYTWFDGVTAWQAYEKAQNPPDSLQHFLVAALKSSIPRKFLSIKVGRKTDMQFFVKLRDLLTILNGVNSGNGYIRWDLNSKQKYVTCPEHLSLNPGVCVLPKQATGKLGSCTVPDVLLAPNVQDSYGGSNSDTSLILNIWINFGGFVDIISNAIDVNTQDFSIQSAISTLLGEVQKALGNVNAFGIHYNELDGLYSIVDRNQVNSEDGNSTDPGSIRITGTNNTVSSFDIHSEISSNMVTELSIAAQNAKSTGVSDGEKECEQRLVYWGDGCTGRFSYPDSGSNHDATATNPSGSSNVDSRDFDSLQEKMEKVYIALGGGKGGNIDTSYREGATGIYSECQLAGENYIKDFVSDNLQSLGEESSTTVQQNGLIPVKATITTMGVGHFIIGTIFTLDQKLLPSKYSGVWGYVITGIEHKVDNKGWTTVVKTTGYLLKNKEVSKKAKVSKNTSQSDFGSMKPADLRNVSYESDRPVEQRQSPDIEENTENMENKDTLLGYFQKVYPPTHGLCAKGTRWLAWGYAEGKQGMQSQKSTKNAANADNPNFGNTLPSKYSQVAHKEGLLKSEIVAYMGNASNFQVGDVAQYYHTDYPGGPWATNTNGSERHVQFHKGGGKWETDTKGNYGTSFVYGSKSSKYWTLNVFRCSAGLHSDWSGMGSR